MALRVKLVRGMSGHPEGERETLRGMGLTKVGRERVLPDNSSTRGMIAKVSWAVEVQQTSDEFKPFGRRSRANSQREAAKSSAKPG